MSGQLNLGGAQEIVRKAIVDDGLERPPEIVAVESAEELSPEVRAKFEREKGEGSSVDAFYHNGRVVVLMDGVRAAADDLGISVADRLRQIGRHEVVHDMVKRAGGLSPLLAPDAEPGRVAQILQGVIDHAQRNSPEELQMITAPREAGGYGHDLSTPEGFARAAEELLGRFKESYSTAPGPVRRAAAWFKSGLRRLHPGLAWSDNDLRALLRAATLRTNELRSEDEGSPMGAESAESEDSDIRFAQKSRQKKAAPKNDSEPLTTDDLRLIPGKTTGGKNLPHASGYWLNAGEPAPIPGQIARLLHNKEFNTFHDLRKAIWKAISEDPELTKYFSRRNLKNMKREWAPYAPKTHQVNASHAGMRFNLHHIKSLEEGGAVYDLRNLQIVSPLVHKRIHQNENFEEN